MPNALVESARKQMAEARRKPRHALLDLARGGLMGATTDVLGYPVDLVTMALRPLGYNVEKPVGGPDWLASKLTCPTGSLAETAGRAMFGMLTPGPEELLRMAGVLKPKTVNELITYHGSPHRINNVDVANPVKTCCYPSHDVYKCLASAARIAVNVIGGKVSDALDKFCSGLSFKVTDSFRPDRGNPQLGQLTALSDTR